MTSRERMLLSMNHEEPDRIPLFEPNFIETTEAYSAELLQFFKNYPFDSYAGTNGMVGSPWEQKKQADGSFMDGYGCRYKFMGVGSPYCVHHPLANATTVSEIDDYDWPDPEAPGLIIENAREKAKALQEKKEGLVIAGVGTTFHQYHYLRGFEQWMMDIKLNPEIHEAIAGHIHRVNSTLFMRFLEEVGDYVDMVMTGDDMGTSVSSYMSPDDFRSMIKPNTKDFNSKVKARFPHIKIYRHAHGQIMELLPDLIDCEIDVLNPILPLDGMDPVRLKRDFGKDLCFHGGIDIEHILSFESVEKVRDHVREVIDILAPGGGYWFKAQAISPFMPSENVIAAYETALECGVYG